MQSFIKYHNYILLMYILSPNIIKRLTNFKRKSKSYKKFQAGINYSRDLLVRLLYKTIACFRYYSIIVTFNKKKLNRYITREVRLYDYKLGLCCKDIMACLDKNKVGSLMVGYVVNIGFYGILICYALGVLEVGFSVRNILTCGILFNLFKEELFPMLILLIRGHKI